MMLFLALSAALLVPTDIERDSVVVRLSLTSSPDRPPLEWIMTDSSNVPIEMGKTPWETTRDVRAQLFTVCGTRPGEQLSMHIQISRTMSLSGRAECIRFGHENGKVVLRGVGRGETVGYAQVSPGG
ncbi:MAG: hypothetical protein IBJ03_06885 [Gemmatimonadaceae bacterium]|nr:hypothetical protein [Gemmatimonadaceae bacterium]